MHDHDETNPFAEVVEKVCDSLRKLGLYAEDVVIMTDNEDAVPNEEEQTTPDVHKLISDGEANFAIVGKFLIGEVAFTDRILNPEKYDTDVLFANIAPSESEMTVESIREAAKSGKPLFESLDEDD